MAGGRKGRGYNQSRRDRFPGGRGRGFKRTGGSASVAREEQTNRKKLKVGDRLKESDVGITEFINEEGFFGIIKERYTDFHVNEIGLDGRMAELTSQDTAVPATTEEDPEQSRKLIPEPIWEKLQGLTGTEVNTSPIEIDVTELSKDERRAIHSAAKHIANVLSQTVERDDRKVMLIRVKRDSPGDKDGREDERERRVDWKKLGGTYCRFILHKVNTDTMDALNQLARSLRIKSNNLSYAGTKDRRAWTSQWVSLRRGNPANILRAAKAVRGAFVGNFEYSQEPLKLGMLSGNRFKIALRNVTATDEQIERTMTSLRDNGFINYYGLQRFGTIAAIPTYEIGKALLQGKWNEAIELILKPREGEQDRDLADARKLYQETKDAFAAYEKINRSDKIEAALLRGIQTAGDKNPQGALDSIPRNVRLMYIHAYQSYVWNHMVSKRIKEFGKKPVVGDLVYARDSDSIDFDQSMADEQAQPEPEPEAEAEAEAEANEDTDSQMIASAETTTSLPSVTILRDEDLHKYSFNDILMPQVGWKVQYPNYAKSWFEEFLAKDGLSIDLRQKNRKYSLGGAYRKILQVPTDIQWRIIRYKEKHSDLLRCDMDRMKNLPEPADVPDGTYRGLIVEMTLKSSTYATMALREIVKCDTSPETQASLSEKSFGTHDTVESSEIEQSSKDS